MFEASVAFLAFANDDKDFLSGLKDESKAVYEALLPVEEKYKSLIIRREESAENNDIAYYLGRYKDRVAIFHYGGHANGKQLSFEGETGNAEGLSNLLGLQKKLRLVFLNACATKEQASLYIRSGVKAVIATDLPIKDEHAQRFSTAFYSAFAQNYTLEEAYIAAAGSLKALTEYKDAKDEIIYYDTAKLTEAATRKDKTNIAAASVAEDEIIEEKNVRHIFRALGTRGQQKNEPIMPWRLYVNAAHKDVLQWKITEPPIKEYLHQGSNAYFLKLREGRFSYINFEVNSYIKNKFGQPEEAILSKKIEEIWSSERRHVLIVGKGGSGKTTNTVRIWKQFVAELNNWSKPIPLYISLSEYNQKKSENNFIIYQISEHYLGKQRLPSEAQNSLLEILKKPIVDTEDEYVPAFILLLDGLDEVTVEQEQLLDEIDYLASNYRGLQIIVTNSFTPKGKWMRQFNRIELVPPQLTITDDILSSGKFTGNSLETLLKNPMMRELYNEAEEVINRHWESNLFQFKLPMTRRGELMWNFFEVELAKQYEKYVEQDSEDFLYFRYKFLLKHVLPFVAFQMEKQGFLSFDEDQMQAVIKEVATKIYQRHFLKIFKEYRRYFAYFNLEAADWVKEEERFELLTLQLSSNFPSFIKSEDKFYFSHQLYRDYLAAVHIRNDIYVSLKRFMLPNSLVERVLPDSDKTWSLLGELEGEHYHHGETATEFSAQTLLEQVLERCRGVYDKEKIGFLILNILNIWKELRGELSGLNLSGLDLRDISLNGVKLQNQDHSHQHTVNFNQTLINRKVFFANMEKGNVVDVRFSAALKINANYNRLSHDSTLFFASASADKTLKLWDVTSKRCFSIVDDAEAEVTSVDFSPCGQYVIYAAKDWKLRMWNIKSGERAFEEEVHSDIVTCARFSPDGQHIVTTSEDTTIKIWSVKNGILTYVKTLEKHRQTVSAVAFSNNGKYLATGSWDRTVGLWDWKSGRCLWLKEVHVSLVTSIAFSPDDAFVLSGSSDDTILEWNARNGAVYKKYLAHHKGVNAVAYLLDNKCVISGSGDKNIKIWNRKTGEVLRTLTGHEDYVMSVQPSPDGQSILSGSSDGTIKIWSIATGECLHTFDNYNGLFVQGCDFRRLHQDSHLQNADKTLLQQFGAILNDEDEKIWLDLTDRLCYMFKS